MKFIHIILPQRFHFQTSLLCLTFILFSSLVGLPFFILYIFGDPYRRGFYCDDDSIRYPFKESTVPSTALFIVCIGLSIILVSIQVLISPRITQ